MIVRSRPFTAHADDSGKKNTEMVVVAGYVSESVKWELLQKRWLPKVQKRGLVEFKRSAYDIRKHGTDFLHELIDLIHEYADYGFAYFIYCDDWREIAKEYALELYHVVPYSTCARTCIGSVREWCAVHKVESEHMAYVFDKGSQDAGELIELLKIDESREARSISLTTDGSERIAGLQASDFLAWEMRNQFLNNNSDPNDWDDLTPELAYMLKGRPFEFQRLRKMPKFGFYRKADLIKLCRSAKIPLLKDVPAEIWDRPRPIRLRWPPTKA